MTKYWKLYNSGQAPCQDWAVDGFWKHFYNPKTPMKHKMASVAVVRATYSSRGRRRPVMMMMMMMMTMANVSLPLKDWLIQGCVLWIETYILKR
jgi:hypothetical protein